MNKLSEKELWDRYQTELREIYDRKKDIKPIYPLFHLINEYYRNEIFPMNKIAGEVGFGNGGLLESISRIFYRCYGLDISPKNIQVTKSKLKAIGIENITFEVYNVLDKKPPKLLNFLML